MLDYNDVTFYGKRIDNDEWVRGFFTKEQRGSLFVPVIQMIKEWDSGDYIESFEMRYPHLTKNLLTVPFSATIHDYVNLKLKELKFSKKERSEEHTSEL